MFNRGEIGYSEFFFIVLNLIFFSVIFLFIGSSSSGALVYEQAYAKEIALFLDKAEPGMKINLDFSKGKEISEKNKYEGSLVFIDMEKNEVLVTLTSSGGYSYKFFTNYDVSYGFSGDDLNQLVINVNEEKNE